MCLMHITHLALWATAPMAWEHKLCRRGSELSVLCCHLCCIQFPLQGLAHLAWLCFAVSFFSYAKLSAMALP